MLPMSGFAQELLLENDTFKSSFNQVEMETQANYVSCTGKEVHFK